MPALAAPFVRGGVFRFVGAPVCCAALLGTTLASWSDGAQAAPTEIYRCPGNPVVYTSDLRLVRAGRCTRLGAPVVAVRQAATVAAATSGPPPSLAAKGAQRAPIGGAMIARHVQQQRDADRVQILKAELGSERERLVQLKQQWQALQSAPVTDADAARPDAAALSQAISRSESDLIALDRELARAAR